MISSQPVTRLLLACLFLLPLAQQAQTGALTKPNSTEASQQPDKNHKKTKTKSLRMVTHLVYGPMFLSGGQLTSQKANVAAHQATLEMGTKLVKREKFQFQAFAAVTAISFEKATPLTHRHGGQSFLNPSFGLRVANRGAGSGWLSFSLGVTGGMVLGENELNLLGQWVQNPTASLKSEFRPGLMLGVKPSVSVRLSGSNFVALSYDILYLGHTAGLSSLSANQLFIAPTLSYHFR